MVSLGLFVCGREEAIPLRSIEVRAFLQGYLAGFRSILTYENNTPNPVEVFFRTPVDDSHAIVGLKAHIDGRNITAEVQEKDKARKRYVEAISSGRTAAFGEEKQGDVFSLVLGNLPPGEKAVLHLTMVGELAVEPDGAVRFVLPTVLKPRYTPPGSTDPLAPEDPTAPSSRRQFATGPSEYAFNLVVRHAAQIAEVQSPSHKISVENIGQNINVTLAEEKQTDIVILVKPKEVHKPLVLIEPGLSNGDNAFQKAPVIMISFFPELKGDPACLQAACEFVFLVDRSGSMAGSYINDAAKTLLLFLKSIPEGCYFNVMGFGSTFERLFPESMPYNQKNLEKAVKHVENLEADLGGTELFDPLKDIFSHAPMKGLPRQVFVLTDGSISNTDSVIDLVARNSTNSRCFSFGIGSGASSTLVKGIAQAGKGTAEFITSGERMQSKVIRSLKRALQPAVTHTHVSYTLPKDVTATTVPKASLPAIFIGDRLIVFAILHQRSQSSPQTGSICLSGDLLGATIEHKMNFQIPPAVTNDSENQVSTIHYLAAKKLIKELESKILDCWRPAHSENAEIVKLSCESNVICSKTAFIAVDEERKEPVKGSLVSWNLLPKKEDMGCKGSRSLPVQCRSNAFRNCFEEEEDEDDEYFETKGERVLNDYDDVYGEMSEERGLDDYDDVYCRMQTKCVLTRGGYDYDDVYGEMSEECGLDDYDDVYREMSEERVLEDYDACLGEQKDACFKSISKKGAGSALKQKASNLVSFGRLSTTKRSSRARDALERIIDLQLASGAWNMSKKLSDVMGKTLAEIKNACPMQCKGNMKAVWATILVLRYLVRQYSGFKDEWELVALKAEAWLATQNLPPGCSVQDLQKESITFVF